VYIHMYHTWWGGVFTCVFHVPLPIEVSHMILCRPNVTASSHVAAFFASLPTVPGIAEHASGACRVPNTARFPCVHFELSCCKPLESSDWISNHHSRRNGVKSTLTRHEKRCVAIVTTSSRHCISCPVTAEETQCHIRQVVGTGPPQCGLVAIRFVSRCNSPRIQVQHGNCNATSSS